MKHELIKNDDYLFILSAELTKDNSLEKGFRRIVLPNSKQYNLLAHLPLNGAPYIDLVDVLPDIENNEILQYISKNYYKVNSLDELNGELLAVCNAILNTKETYKYTEKDMWIIRNKLVDILPTGDVSAWDMIQAISSYIKWFDEEIKSLNQPKLPIAFECEPRYLDIDEIRERGKGFLNGNSIVPKTITNSDGRTEWVGKYLF